MATLYHTPRRPPTAPPPPPTRDVRAAFHLSHSLPAFSDAALSDTSSRCEHEDVGSVVYGCDRHVSECDKDVGGCNRNVDGYDRNVSGGKPGFQDEVGGSDSGCDEEVGGGECGRSRGQEEAVLICGGGGGVAGVRAAGGSGSVRAGGGEQGGLVPRCHDGAGSRDAACMMKHKCGSTLLSGPDHHYYNNNNTKPHAATMAASDTTQPAASAATLVSAATTTSTGGGGGGGGSGSGSGAPLRSALKRAGQKSRGHRVLINEAKNECLEADYVILVHEESEPQLVSLRNLDLTLGPHAGPPTGPPAGPPAGPPELTLSPPEGYKDCFSHHTLVEDSDTESGSGEGLGETEGGRPHLPDLVTHRSAPSATKLTVENVRHHDQLMQGREKRDPSDPKLAKTGILKGGKLWRNGGDGKRSKGKVEEEEAEEPRRSVRFSGRDEYSLLESLPLDAANSAALARVMPKLRELGVLLADPRPHDWHLELSPITPEPEAAATTPTHHHAPPDDQPPTPPPPPPPQMDDEQIRESMQRYDEMRRRIAAAEGRDNTSVCSDESKSSSDSQSSDSTMTETRIRRLENADVAHLAGGVMRSNSEVRRAIERNALRRSLIRFSEARKKDTNKNDKNDKGETSLMEKLKWLTASEDATNGNSEQRDYEAEGEGEDEAACLMVDPRVQDTIAQYRRLAEMFNKTTAIRVSDIMVPGDVREWKLKSDLFPSGQGSQEADPEDVPEPHSGAATPTVFQGVPTDLVPDDDTEKLIYSGGVRYTREGTLPPATNNDDDEGEGDPTAPSPATTQADARKQFLAQMATPTITVQVNGAPPHVGDRSSLASNPDSYTFEDIDEALHDDRSSSVPSSSQSSPRLSGKSDVDGTNTTESGYSSNETNGELQCPLNGLPLTAASLYAFPLPFSLPNVDIDELAEFVRQDAERLERLRRRYDTGELEDHGFSRRPSVRGIKPRFGSTTDLLNQIANQLASLPDIQSSLTGPHMTWPYRHAGDEDPGGSGGSQRRRAAPTRAALPALQEDILYVPTSDLSPQAAAPTTLVPPTSLTHTKTPRVVHVYASTGDLRAPPPPRLIVPRESPPPDLIRPGVGATPARVITSVSLEGPLAGLAVPPQMPTPAPYEYHIPPCRRPASVHGHLPADVLMTRGALAPPGARPHSSLSHYPAPRVPVHYHPYEEPPPACASFEGGHPVLAQRGSYPGTLPVPHYQTVLAPTEPRYVHPPPYGSQHSHPRPPAVSPREAPPLTRTPLPQVLSVPQASLAVGGGGSLHQCGPQHTRAVGSGSDVCSPVWSHPHHPLYFPPPSASSHMSYTTPLVPEVSPRLPGPPLGLPLPTSMGPLLMNGGVSKLEALRDERGVPEGASSSPRGSLDPQYPPQHGSPTRESVLMPRHPPLPLNIT